MLIILLDFGLGTLRGCVASVPYPVSGGKWMSLNYTMFFSLITKAMLRAGEQT